MDWLLIAILIAAVGAHLIVALTLAQRQVFELPHNFQ
jgi:hypothetical protein